MNLYRRGMIFATFLGSCLTLALSGAAMGTRYWVEAHARRTSNPNESDGRIHFGLFRGSKYLNVAYGWRRYEIDVMEVLKAENEFLIWGLWVATTGCLSLAMVFATISAAFAVINTAITPVSTIAGIIGLYFWNILTGIYTLDNIASTWQFSTPIQLSNIVANIFSKIGQQNFKGITLLKSCPLKMVLFNLAAVITWAVQFHQKLHDNVMTKEDLAINWTSRDMAHFGYSFWFVVGAVIASVLNIAVIYFGTNKPREKKGINPVMEEKGNGAIMLY